MSDEEEKELWGEEAVAELADQLSDLSLEEDGHYSVLDLSLDESGHHSDMDYDAGSEYSPSESNSR